MVHSFDNLDSIVFSCPHCLSTSIIRSGKSPDKLTQRYKCKKCMKTFKATTGTPTHWMHKRSKIKIYLDAIHKGLSVRKAAEFAKISKNTSFIWRHKFLSSIPENTVNSLLEKQQTIKLIQTPYSAKGRKKKPEKIQKTTNSILIESQEQIQIIKLNPIKNIKHAIKILTSKNQDVIMLAQPSKLLTSVIKHSEINTLKQNYKKNILFEKLNKFKISLEQWMSRFRGVATKYLQQYWKWFCVLNNTKELNSKSQMFIRLCTENRTLDNYRLIARI